MRYYFQLFAPIIIQLPAFTFLNNSLFSLKKTSHIKNCTFIAASKSHKKGKRGPLSLFLRLPSTIGQAFKDCFLGTSRRTEKQLPEGHHDEHKAAGPAMFPIHSLFSFPPAPHLLLFSLPVPCSYSPSSLHSLFPFIWTSFSL